ncbi:hypothetical protein BKA62DRAFT_349666 [Auriculariales sp. MPI-PUGE-AT-0066]|nr:hypothetical protein BKA62DRAFT_349666 [Auriculariales sp. MPI-PUGE-AT-0066]
MPASRAPTVPVPVHAVSAVVVATSSSLVSAASVAPFVPRAFGSNLSAGSTASDSTAPSERPSTPSLDSTSSRDHGEADGPSRRDSVSISVSELLTPRDASVSPPRRVPIVVKGAPLGGVEKSVPRVDGTGGRRPTQSSQVQEEVKRPSANVAVVRADSVVYPSVLPPAKDRIPMPDQPCVAAPPVVQPAPKLSKPFSVVNAAWTSSAPSTPQPPQVLVRPRRAGMALQQQQQRQQPPPQLPPQYEWLVNPPMPLHPPLPPTPFASLHDPPAIDYSVGMHLDGTQVWDLWGYEAVFVEDDTQMGVSERWRSGQSVVESLEQEAGTKSGMAGVEEEVMIPAPAPVAHIEVQPGLSEPGVRQQQQQQQQQQMATFGLDGQQRPYSVSMQVSVALDSLLRPGSTMNALMQHTSPLLPQQDQQQYVQQALEQYSQQQQWSQYLQMQPPPMPHMQMQMQDGSLAGHVRQPSPMDPYAQRPLRNMNTPPTQYPYHGAPGPQYSGYWQDQYNPPDATVAPVAAYPYAPYIQAQPGMQPFTLPPPAPMVVTPVQTPPLPIQFGQTTPQLGFAAPQALHALQVSSAAAVGGPDSPTSGKTIRFGQVAVDTRGGRASGARGRGDGRGRGRGKPWTQQSRDRL